jgi:hypothetical protein
MEEDGAKELVIANLQQSALTLIVSVWKRLHVCSCGNEESRYEAVSGSRSRSEATVAPASARAGGGAGEAAAADGAGIARAAGEAAQTLRHCGIESRKSCATCFAALTRIS